MDALKKTSGIAWGPGAISNGTWGGASLRDVLKAAGLDVDAPENQGVFHVVLLSPVSPLNFRPLAPSSL